MRNTTTTFVGSDNITPPLQIGPSSTSVAALEVQVSPSAYMNCINGLPVGRPMPAEGYFNNSTAAILPFQQVSSSTCMNAEFTEGRPEMSNCMTNGVSANAMTSAFGPVYYSEVAEGRPGTRNCMLDRPSSWPRGGSVINAANHDVREHEMMGNASTPLQDPSSSWLNNQSMNTTSSAAARKEAAPERRETVINDALALGMAPTNLQNQDTFPSSSNTPIPFTKKATEEYVTDAFIKLLACNSTFPSVDSEVLKDPNVREFLDRVQEHGFPSSLSRGDSKLCIDKSLLNIRHDVYKHMLKVTESWKTTGCTLLMFNLNPENRGKYMALGKHMYVLGFYSPEGFIFMEAPDMDIDADGFKDALKRHSPSLYIDDATLAISHPPYHGLGDNLVCDLNDELSIDWMTEVQRVGAYGVKHYRTCLRHEIQMLCINICSSSTWADSLVNKAVQLHEHLFQCPHWSLRSWYKRIFTKTGEMLKYSVNVSSIPGRRLFIFLSIMLLEDELKEKLSYHIRFTRFLSGTSLPELEEILNNSIFWGDGRQVKRVLIMTLKIPDIMESLVPTVGYSAMTMDRVKHNIFNSYGPIPMEKEISAFWQELDSELRRTFVGSVQTASYLNPFYFLQQVIENNRQVKNELEKELVCFVDPEERDKVVEELQRYFDTFHKSVLNYKELGNHHPVKLWEKYGGDLPFLRKYAANLLSRPVNCMCNQVMKHVHQLQGTDDYVLRLNVKMMNEFNKLGDDIFKPINARQIDDWLNRRENMSGRI